MVTEDLSFLSILSVLVTDWPLAGTLLQSSLSLPEILLRDVSFFRENLVTVLP